MIIWIYTKEQLYIFILIVLIIIITTYIIWYRTAIKDNRFFNK